MATITMTTIAVTSAMTMYGHDTKNYCDKPAVTPDINDLAPGAPGGLLGVTQLVEKILAIWSAVTLTRDAWGRFHDIPLVVDRGRRSSRIPGRQFL